MVDEVFEGIVHKVEVRDGRCYESTKEFVIRVPSIL